MPSANESDLKPGQKEGKSKEDKPPTNSKELKNKKDEKKEEELTEEDIALKQSLELMVERVQDPDAGVQKLALESMRHEIRTSTSSMTSVPKPLKFLRPHYQTLKDNFEVIAPENKKVLADIISVLAMTMSATASRESLKFRLLGSEEDIGSWGHEYVRNLAAEIGQEYNTSPHFAQLSDDLLNLVKQIVPFHVEHNAEPEAVDLLMEVDRLDLLLDEIDITNYKRTCLYLTSCASYVPEPDYSLVLDVAYQIYVKVKKYTDALKIALKMDNLDYIKEVFSLSKDLGRKQLAFILARQGYGLNLEDDVSCNDDEKEILQEILNNAKLNEYFLSLARDLDVMEPKVPEDIYKAHLIDGRASTASNIDSARQNLASTFVNAFVNAGFGQDKLLTVSSDSSSANWLFKNKDHGKISATASLGLIVLWDIDGGLPQIDKYLYSNDNNIVAGALLGIGVVNSGIKNECDPAFALLCDSVEKDDPMIRIGAILGLGIAYAGTQKQEIFALLSPIISDSKIPLDVVSFTCLALGLVFVSSCNEECAQTIIFALMERDSELSEPLAKFICLGLSLLFLGKQDDVDAIFEVSQTLNEKISKFCQTTLTACAYAGSGNVLKIQELLGVCEGHLEGKNDTHQQVAALGIALISISEELGTEMSLRMLQHFLQYGDQNVRRVVPLAFGLLSVSNPRLNVMDTLSRLSHDSDPEVAMGAIISLGLIGAGTNNARIAGLLRNLSSYYYKDPNLLFCVRIGQGLVHLGKGLLTLNPYHSDRFLLSNVGLAGLTCFLFSCLDLKSTILAKYHFCLYFLVPSIQVRMLMTVDEDLKPLPVAVRVGQAVDVVGQAGRPKTITGFQTHTTPVLLSAGDRAELATDKYIPVSSVLEGVVILQRNPDYVEDHLGS